MKIKEIIQKINYKKSSYIADDEVKEIAFDSRKVQKGDVFFALKGANNGENYIGEAIKNGAVCVFCEKDYPQYPCVVVDNTRRALSQFCAERYGHPEQKVKIIGVTGTNGKTTTTYMIQGLYEMMGVKCAVIGTLGAYVDGEVYSTGMTTPDTPAFFTVLSKCVNKGVTVLAMEVSAHAIYYEKLYGVPFTYGVFTNVTQDHLDFFKTMERYCAIKKDWILSENVSTAIVSVDDPIGKELSTKKADKSVTIATEYCDFQNMRADLSVGIIEGGKRFILTYRGNNYRVDTPFYGRYNVNNLCLALGVLLSDGYGIAELLSAVRSLRPVPGRFQVVPYPKKIVVVDYAHTPDGLEKVLTAAREIAPRNLICVFGCGGDRDRDKRPKMGRIASEISDQVVLTSDNPRKEDPESILADIEKGISIDNYTVIKDRKEAICYALDFAKENDVIVIAGKGAEEYQEISGEKYPFSDEKVIIEHRDKIKEI